MITRILLADDHRIVLDGLRSLLDAQPDFEVVAEAADGREALKAARAARPDVAVMDLRMPGMNGIEAIRRMTAPPSQVRVVGLSMYAERRLVSAALGAGAAAYLLKDCAADELVTAIRRVRSGLSYLSPSVTAVVVEDYRSRLSRDAGHKLTPREREILQLLAEGHSTRDIAEGLHVSVKTVGTHREHIMEKLGIHSLAGLTKYAVRHGLSSLERHRPRKP